MPRTSLAVVAIACALALAAGCTGSKHPAQPRSSAPASSPAPSNAVLGNVVQPGYTAKGGTVQLLASENFEHLDPVQNYTTYSSDLGRLIYRTLTFIDDTPGRTPTIKPDLATSLGTPSDGGRVWTYHLRTGLKFEDGTPITAKDVKYGIERSFARDVYQNGPTYLADRLDVPRDAQGQLTYRGPYADPNADLAAVQTPDDHTLVFHFAGPQPDADWMLSLFYTAPVPKAKDTKQDYDFHPVASGPYKIGSYTPNKQLVLVRNNEWNPATDPNRPALPDRFVLTMGVAGPTISSRLIADEGEDRYAVTLDETGDLQASDLSRLRPQSVRQRFINGTKPCVSFIYFNEQKITSSTVRKAIATAINRQALITARGGPLFGSIPDSIVTSEARGYQPAHLGLAAQGDIAAAKQILGTQQVPTLHYAVPAGKPEYEAVAVQVQDDLKRLGIDVVLDKIPAKAFYKTILSANGPDMGPGSWCADWPTMASIVPPLLGPDSSGTGPNPNNLSRFYDPTLSKQIADLALSAEPPAVLDQKFAQLANHIQTTNWPVLPISASLDPQVVGSKVRNAGVSPLLGLVDLNTIGVAP